ncbi:phosphatase [Deinococcus aerolatus]|uniref:Phosphatase n=1 Tax=Deinococcus aerolatus TaxID=522487 RepID=A0ABQ2G5Z9_9DEIO|nr:phosphatase domain-containing protein [Deinococcus aerolatus]GGL77202.1 phosphatase [Deinococcus aerolatus]
MNSVKTAFKRALPAVERAVLVADRAISGYVQPRRARGKLILQPYVGWGTPHGVELTGRVLLPRIVSPPTTGDRRWRNFVNSMRRLFSREVGGVQVNGVLDGVSASVLSDDGGYFTLSFTPLGPLPGGWHEAALSIEGKEGQTRARVQVIDNARFGVISDLDDTVIQSDVTSLPRMLMTALTGNARTRSPFPGVGALYRALVREGEVHNPIFYVSSSPWNFFDLLWQFLDYRRIPLGPLFLRNWGMGLLAGHGGHKLEIITRLFERFPHLNFVLIGDSGEQDALIYSEVVRRYAGRVLAVYIRDLTGVFQDETVLKLRGELARTGVDLVLAADSLNAAGHAMAMGLITPGEYRGVLVSVTGPTER